MGGAGVVSVMEGLLSEKGFMLGCGAREPVGKERRSAGMSDEEMMAQIAVLNTKIDLTRKLARLNNIWLVFCFLCTGLFIGAALSGNGYAFWGAVLCWGGCSVINLIEDCIKRRKV